MNATLPVPTQARSTRNQRYLRQLYGGPFPGHALCCVPPPVFHHPDPAQAARGRQADVTIGDRPVSEWVPAAVASWRRRVEWLDALDDDAVPYVNLLTHSGILAAAFGCPVHVYDADTNPAATAIVRTPAEADALGEGDLHHPALERWFAFARAVVREVGPTVPLTPMDLQSPFDVAALIWDKTAMFEALVEAPDSVLGLVAKCQRLIERVQTALRSEFPQAGACHCPQAWAPPELGIWLSEDEIGSLSPTMFRRFSLPSLLALSERFGGISLHCCAAADHQYPLLRDLPGLRGMNRVLPRTSPGQRAIDAFAGRAVLAWSWMNEAQINDLLDGSAPDTRHLFCIGDPSGQQTIDEVRPVYERLRARCPRLG